MNKHLSLFCKECPHKSFGAIKLHATPAEIEQQVTESINAYYHEKWLLLTRGEIEKLQITKADYPFECWYEALQSYAESQGGNWERSLVTDCGTECWKDLYEVGLTVDKAFVEGFIE